MSWTRERPWAVGHVGEKFRFNVGCRRRLAEEGFRLAGHVWNLSQVCVHDPCARRPIGGPPTLVTDCLSGSTRCPASPTAKATKACDISQVLAQGC
jgi:hypothetical protein